MIRNIVFDLGNVLCLWEPEQQLDMYVDHPMDKELLMNIVFLSEEWQEADAGRPLEEVILAMQDKLPKDLKNTARLLVENWWRLVPINEPLCELARRLKEKGYAIYLLSNTSEVFQQLAPRISCLDVFDGMVLSYQEMTRKPQEKIFRILFERYGLEPQESFLIDDLSTNMGVAKALGMQGHIYDGDDEALLTSLKDHGVLYE